MTISTPASDGGNSSFNPLEFYTIAVSLIQSPSEASYRTAIGRAYYAVFLTIANIPAVQRVMPPASYGEGSHVAVINAVRRLHRLNIAEHLNDLRILRTLADYNLASNANEQDWAQCWNDAQRLADWLIAALPSLRNARP